MLDLLCQVDLVAPHLSAEFYHGIIQGLLVFRKLQVLLQVEELFLNCGFYQLINIL